MRAVADRVGLEALTYDIAKQFESLAHELAELDMPRTLGATIRQKLDAACSHDDAPQKTRQHHLVNARNASRPGGPLRRPTLLL